MEFKADANAAQHKIKSLVLVLILSGSEENLAVEGRKERRRDLIETLEDSDGGV